MIDVGFYETKEQFIKVAQWVDEQFVESQDDDIRNLLLVISKHLWRQSEDAPPQDDTLLKPRIIELAKQYASLTGRSPVRGIYYLEHLGAWCTSNENSQEDTKIGVTLPDALQFLEGEVTRLLAGE